MTAAMRRLTWILAALLAGVLFVSRRRRAAYAT